MERTPPEIPDGLSIEEQEAFLRRHGLAQNLRDMMAAAYLHGSAANPLRNLMDTDVCLVYIEKLLDEAGASEDPILQMVAEQIALAHHNIGRLYMKSAAAETIDAAEAYNAAIPRLLGEFRRLVSDFRGYSSPATPRQVTVVNQQNVSAGDQQIAYVGGDEKKDGNKKKPLNNELASSKAVTHELPTNTIPEPATSRGRQKEPVEAERADSGWPREATPSGVKESAVATRNRTTDSRGQGEIGTQLSAAGG